VLQKECDLNHVIDPVGGSWFVESATAEIAASAWALFQDTEKLGGMEAALRAGVPQKAVSETAFKKTKAATSRRDSIVGVTQYANPKEQPLDVPATDAKTFYKRRTQQIASHRTSLEDSDSRVVLGWLAKIIELNGHDLFEVCVEAASAGATLGEITRALRINDSPCEPITPVCLTRVATPIEELRTAMNRRANGTAKVFLCNMGSLKEHKARADFSRGFFSVGGYDVISPSGFKTPEDAVVALLKSQADIAVICSTDENYPALVPALMEEIRALKPNTIIVLAGFPPEQIEAHKKSGVAEFIHIRADVVEVLARIHAQLGIA
jgi:methylmalonyl-CoA mutase